MYSVYKASNVVYISHSGVSLLAESVSVCVRRALEVALTSFTPTLSVPQRLEREERRLKEMLDGQSLLAALGQVDALLTSLDRLVVAIIIIHKQFYKKIPKKISNWAKNCLCQYTSQMGNFNLT